jgi:hypothetical protein
MAKQKINKGEERPYCIVCGRVVGKFSSAEAERIYSETGECENCQIAIKKSLREGKI